MAVYSAAAEAYHRSGAAQRQIVHAGGVMPAESNRWSNHGGVTIMSRKHLSRPLAVEAHAAQLAQTSDDYRLSG